MPGIGQRRPPRLNRHELVLADRRSLEHAHPARDGAPAHRCSRRIRIRPVDRCQFADSPPSSTWPSNTWTGRAVATRTSPRSPQPTANSTAGDSGTRERPTRTPSGRRTPRSSLPVRDYVEAVGANFGRVRIIKLEPQTRDEAIRSIHRDDNNRFNPVDEGWVVRSWVELTDNPDSYMLLMDSGPDGLPDRDTELRVPLHKGARFLVDTQRLWHVVVHTGDAPRYALISSFESGATLERWVESQRSPCPRLTHPRLIRTPRFGYFCPSRAGLRTADDHYLVAAPMRRHRLGGVGTRSEADGDWSDQLRGNNSVHSTSRKCCRVSVWATAAQHDV